MVSYCVILKMAVIIKDLYGNLGNRFKEINSRWGFPIKKKHFTLITWFVLALCNFLFSRVT